MSWRDVISRRGARDATFYRLTSVCHACFNPAVEPAGLFNERPNRSGVGDVLGPLRRKPGTRAERFPHGC
jgi:hypothetical protein